MWLYKTRKNIEKFITGKLQYAYIVLKAQFIRSKEKRVYIEVQDIILNRYLYNFIKFFKLNDYTVYLPKEKKIINILSKNSGELIFGSWILKEGVKFGKPKTPNLIISQLQLSNEYFDRNNGLNVYHVPMSEHPAFYFHAVEIPDININQLRKNSVFMSGNIDSTYYYEISKSEFFDVISRSEVADFIMKQPYYIAINNLVDLNNYINSEIDFKVILINTKDKFRIPFKDLKITLSQFNFFLALPGMFIPQCHNLIEAMSMKCIPIIHKNYASLLAPPLEHMANSIIYHDLKELDLQLSGLNKLEESLIASMQHNVFEYYQSYLTPESVVKKIEQNEFSKIYILWG